ncbi:MAG: ATP-binding protein [Hyphomonadaceae bacterium]
MIGPLKSLIVRFWPVLRLRTILFGVMLFVAALPGLSAIFLRVYENALVRRTEAELIAQSAAIAAAAAIVWPVAPSSSVAPAGARDATTDRAPPQAHPDRGNGGPYQTSETQGVEDVSTAIDLRASPILPERPKAAALAAPLEQDALEAAQRLAPAIEETKRVTLSSILLLDRNGALLNFPGRQGSYQFLPEVAEALAGRPQTALRLNTTYHRRTFLEIFSQAANIRLHHARPIRVKGQVVGVVLVSRSPRALLRGIYEDRGKIAFGVIGIFVLLIGLSAILGRAIVRPLESLSTASRALAKGKRETPMGSALQVVEIRTLYEDFDAMAQSIDQRSRYLRDFATSVSHEFKTPLAGLRGAIELLQDHEATMSAEERATFLANMAADTGRLSHLVSRLLDLARADMQAIDSDATTKIMDALAVVADSFSSEHFLILGPKGRAATAAAAAMDRPTLEAILMTLLENARQAGATRVEVFLDQFQDRVEIRLANDGPLIPDADKDRIFEPFFTSKRASGGTGIGLSIARSLARGYGGSLDLAPDDGPVTFVLRLPVARPHR